MRYLSLFSGIEAASLAWHPLGWECVGVAEVDPFCCELLKQRFPTVPNLGDVTAPDFIERAKALSPDLVVGGSPCQSFSVAGLGKSLSDARGNLTLRFVEVVRGIDPDFVVWENVPGILPKRDNPFGCFLAGLVGASAPLVPPVGSRWTNAGLVAGPKRTAAWRVLDAQWYGVAQRRSRVFVVSGRARDFRCAEILLEQPCVRLDPPTRGAPRQGLAGYAASGVGAGGRGVERGGESRGQDPVVACFGGNNTGGAIDVATACNAHGGTGRCDFESETFVAGTLRGHHGNPQAEWAWGGQLVAFSSKDHGADAGEVCPTMRSAGHDGSHANGGGPPAVAFHATQDPIGAEIEQGLRQGSEPVLPRMAVRRLTPRECCRLQGAPDDWTLVTIRGKPAADGPRYKSIGNSMAVPVMQWIGRRIHEEASR
jgi:DNA (cytosine-5)-methyltransferase 1